MSDVRFIPEELVPIIHADLLKRYGGSPGIRDRGLLSSALAQASMTARRRYLHRTLFDKAAAYGFHFRMNLPFVDGNKRVAFTLMDMFLTINGWEVIASEEEAYEIMMRLASGKLSKDELAVWLETHAEASTSSRT